MARVRMFGLVLQRVLFCCLSCSFLVITSGCDSYRDDVDLNHPVQQTWEVEEVAFGEIVQFEGVNFEPDETFSLRDFIIQDALVSGRTVLNVGAGTGLTAIVCLQNGARKVVAIDFNSVSVANARYNAANLNLDADLDCRLIPDGSMSPLTALETEEKFDVIIAKWVASSESEVATDELKPGETESRQIRLLQALPNRIKRGGRCVISCQTAIAFESMMKRCEELGYQTIIQDDRMKNDATVKPIAGVTVEIKLPAE